MCWFDCAARDTLRWKELCQHCVSTFWKCSLQSISVRDEVEQESVFCLLRYTHAALSDVCHIAAITVSDFRISHFVFL